jgi:UDP-N-acetylglucosamine acyltransferase
MSSIHPTAIIDKDATIESGVTVGAYSVVSKGVTLKSGVVLHSHVVVAGDTYIGEGTEIFPFASIGHRPQDKKFHGENTRLIVGKNNVIREHVTMNPGTEGGGGLTQVGDNNLFMVASHVAHDCIVGNHIILANNATLAGHVVVGDGAIIGGLAAIHQFVRIGAYAMIGGMSGVEKDVIPYGSVMGERANLAGLNLIGLKRRQIDKENINALRHAFKALFMATEGTLVERAQKVDGDYEQPEVRAMTQFILSSSDRSFCTPGKAA